MYVSRSQCEHYMNFLHVVSMHQCLSLLTWFIWVPGQSQLELTHWNSQPGCSGVEACGNQ